jgi:ribonuclease R
LVSIFISTESAFDPDLQNSAVLRKHPPPDPFGLAKVVAYVTSILGDGVLFNISSSKSIYDSLTAIRADRGNDVANLIEFMVMKCMQPAEYVTLNDSEDNSHFALSFSYYTHFTSPIRRYADIMVHRQIEYSLNKISGCINLQETAAQCLACNVKKTASRRAQEAFDTSFFCIYLRSLKTMHICTGVVRVVMEKQIVVHIPQLGSEAPVHFRVNDKNAKFGANYLVKERKAIPDIVEFDVDEGRVTITWDNGMVMDIGPTDVVNVAILPLQSVPISFCLRLIPEQESVPPGFQPLALSK